MAKDFTPNLLQAQQDISHLLAHIRSLDISPLLYTAPIIDRHSSQTWAQDEVLGLKRFADTIENHSAQLETLARSGVPPKDDPLPGVAGLVTLWKTVISARPPVTAIRSSVKGKGKEEGFVDIIARGGAEWIRIYSKKHTQLLAEFREQDSYVNSDFDDSDDDDMCNSSSSAGPSIPNGRQKGLTNSILDIVDSLLAVARETERVPGAAPPTLTLRLSRIEEHPLGGYEDDRLARTFQLVRDKGVNLVFGDLSDIQLAHLRLLPRHFELRPTVQINLDPTALMGLCSDLLHHPLPLSESGARERFFRPRSALSPGGRSGRTLEQREEKEGQSAGQSQNSKELVRNLLEEMGSALLPDIRDTLEGVLRAENETGAGVQHKVEFWATRDAVRYLTEALGSDEVVGHGMEQRRMRRMVGLEEGDFFEGSRYEGQEGCLRGLRVRVFEDDEVESSTSRTTNEGSPPATSTEDRDHILTSPRNEPSLVSPPSGPTTSTFHRSLSALTSLYLSEYTRSLSAPDSASLPNFLRPSRLPAPRVTSLSLPFPVVSLGSLHAGARKGMTTLMMGNVVMRELWGQNRWKVRGWTWGNYDGVETCDSPKRGEGERDSKVLGPGDQSAAETTENGMGYVEAEGGHAGESRAPGERRGEAAVWMLPYQV